MRLKTISLALILATPAGAQQFPGIERARSALQACVEEAFDDDVIRNARDSRWRAAQAVERAFLECQTEESGLFSTTAASIAALGSGTERAALQARAGVDRFKISIKSRLTRK